MSNLFHKNNVLSIKKQGYVKNNFDMRARIELMIDKLLQQMGAVLKSG
jgi:hypothetical protein